MRSQIEDQGRRKSYLLDDDYIGGKWDYFPLAMILQNAAGATLLAGILAAGVALVGGRPMKWSMQGAWAAMAIFVPVWIYAMASVTANINIGLRHVFPIYPFAAFILIGLADAIVLLQRRPNCPGHPHASA